MDEKLKKSIEYKELSQTSPSKCFILRLLSTLLLKDNKTKINALCQVLGEVTWIAEKMGKNILKLEIENKKKEVINFMENLENTKEHKLETIDTYYYINGKWEEYIPECCFSEKERDEYLKSVIAKKTIKTTEIYFLSDDNPIKKFEKNYEFSL